MKRLWLSTRITLVTTIVIVATTVIMSLSVYFTLKGISSEHNRESYETQAKLIHQSINFAMQKLSEDLFVISRTPPIQGIIRSERGQGQDYEDNSNTTQWKDRLSKIFESSLRENSDYIQLRYITVKDGGQEIVRVNQNKNEIYRVKGNALQKKGDRDYFKKGVMLSRGSVAFTDFEYNQEKGKIEIPQVITARVITPIYDDEQKVFGLLILNVDIVQYIKEVLSSVVGVSNIVISDRSCNFISYNSKDNTISFNNLANVYQLQDPRECKVDYLKQKIKETGLFYTSDNYVYADSEQQHSDYKVFIFTKIDEDGGIGWHQGYSLLILISLVAAIGSWIIFMYTRHSMQRLHALAESLVSQDSKKSIVSSFTKLNDEVGILARAVEDKTRELDALANSDTLTGLPNRNSLQTNFKLFMDEANSNDSKFAFLFIDLNDFKLINDEHGHDVGDELLISLAEKIRTSLRKTDFCARVAGDEFAIIMRDIKPDSCVAAVDKLLKNLNGEYVLRRHKLKVTVSCGVAIYPDHGASLGKIYKNADIAMYQAKKAKDGKPVIFNLSDSPKPSH